MTDRNRPRRSSRDRSYERRSRYNNENKFGDGENNTTKALNVSDNKRKRSDSDSRGRKRAKTGECDNKNTGNFTEDKSRDRHSVNGQSSLPGLDWCTCEGRLSDRRDTKSIFNHALPGEELIEACPESFQIRQLVEQGRLWVYAITISPAISPDWPRTRFSVEDKEFVFDGFYLLAHHVINVTDMQFTHLGNECQLKLESVALEELEIAVEIADLEWSYKYLFTELLGYSDFVKWTCKYPGSLTTPRTRHVHGCRRFHFFPKFVQDGAKNSTLPLRDLRRVIQNQSGRNVWHVMSHESRDQLRGQLVRHEGRCYRVDHVDPLTSTLVHKVTCFTHYEPVFRRTERKGGHQLFKLTARADRGPRELKLVPDRCLTTAISADLAHVASLLPSLVYHLRLHAALQRVEHVIGVQFSDRQLLHHVIIHPSYWECIDAAARELRDVTSRVTWWGVSPSFSEPSVTAWPVRKRRSVTHLDSEIWQQFSGNQRLEFLGDAVLEFVVSTHLFMLLSDHKAGELSTFRAGLVNNKVLCHLAQQLELDRFVTHLYHRELIEDTKSYQSVVGDCYESLLGAIYLDQGLIAVREFFTRCLFMNDDDHDALGALWQTPPSMSHALLSSPQLSASAGYSATLQRLEALEELTGLVFQNKLLLAAAFTHPSVGTNASLDMLNIGSNQRLEFLGDSVLQLVVSFYLFNRFPEYFEGQLSLVRTTLVNNEMLSQVALELGLHNYIRYLPGEALLADGRAHARMLADTFEAYLAAIYLDRGLVVVETFLSVVLFPRLDHVLEERSWLDSRTRLTRVVLNITKSRTTLPSYRVTGESGPPHLRVYTVTCFLADRPLGQGRGISRSAAEQEAAKNTLLRYEFSRPATDVKSGVIDVNSIVSETDATLVETGDVTDLGEPTEDEVREIDAEF